MLAAMLCTLQPLSVFGPDAICHSPSALRFLCSFLWVDILIVNVCILFQVFCAPRKRIVLIRHFSVVQPEGHLGGFLYSWNFHFVKRTFMSGFTGSLNRLGNMKQFSVID